MVDTADEWDTPLSIPPDLEAEQARLYYPVGWSGTASPADGEKAIERIAKSHPVLEAFHRSPRSTFPLLTHAHALRVHHLDSRLFVYSPRSPWVRIDDGALVVSEALQISVDGDKTEEDIGTAIMLAVAFPIPLIPDNPTVAVALRKYVERFFQEGLRTSQGLIRPGANLPVAKVVATFSTLARETDRLRRELTTLPADHDTLVEIPRQGSVLVLGADGTPAGQARLSALSVQLRAAGRHPVLVRAHPDLPGRNVVQKAAAMALACEHVIVDDTEPSGHLIEIALALAGTTTPFVVLRKDGRYSTSMVAPVLTSFRWTATVDYVDEADGVRRALDRARQLSDERQAALRDNEPWRRRS